MPGVDKMSREERLKTDVHVEACTGVGLGEKLVVQVGREAVLGSVYHLPSTKEGVPVALHLTVEGIGRVVIPWGAITKMVVPNS